MNSFRARILATSLLTGASLLGSPAFAQDTQSTAADQNQATESGGAQPTGPDEANPTPATSAQGAQSGQDIVITGSLIRNPNLTSSSPVFVTSKDEIDLRQSNVAEEVLRELPGVVPSMGSAVNNGNGGASYVDLRGLGSNRNIVLLDGYRVVPSDSVGRVDLNSIPLALVQRVDALTGAAVTTYGADAVTGVVNFITRRDFTGVEIVASGQRTGKGDGNTFRVDTTLGADFGDGRGNAALSIGYQKAKPVYQGDRAWSVESWSAFADSGVGSGTSVPSRFSGTRPIDPATGLPGAKAAVRV